MNERPSKLPRTQRYVSMELSHGGEALETYRLYNSMQAVSVLEQAACALAVGEVSAAFEHRDLHWGNILLEKIEPDCEDDEVEKLLTRSNLLYYFSFWVC